MTVALPGAFGRECVIPKGAVNGGATDMKKNKAVGIDKTRRKFMAYFSSVGLGSTLVPGILWARMQDAGAQQISLAMVTDALKLSGVEFTEAERTQMLNGANQSLTRAKAIQAFHIPNDVSPPFHISAI